MTKLILHPGSPKTATSTIQAILSANRANLAKRGIGLILPSDIRGKPFLGTYLSAYRGKAHPKFNKTAREFFAPWQRKFRTVICSEETFCHDFMPSKKFGQGGIDRAEATADLLSDLGFEKSKVVLTIRPQENFLNSTYTHFVHRHREARKFLEWLETEVTVENLLWTPAVRAFAERFDDTQVVSLASAKGGRGMAGYLEEVMAAFELDKSLLKDLSAETVHNPSPSGRAIHLSRVMNKEIPNPQKSEKVNSFLLQQFPVADFGKFKPQWKYPLALQEMFEADHNGALQLSRGRLSGTQAGQ